MSHSDLRNLHISHEIRASSSLAFKTLHSLVSSYLPIFIAAICSELITVPIIVIPASHLHHPISFFFGILFIFLYSRFLLVIYFIHIGIYMSIPISQFMPPPQPLLPLSPLGVHTFVLYICALQTSSSLPIF